MRLRVLTLNVQNETGGPAGPRCCTGSCAGSGRIWWPCQVVVDGPPAGRT